MTTVNIPNFGTIKGITSPSIKDTSVLEFRGIPFGTIPARFQRSTLHPPLESPHDGSVYGPMCPSQRIETILGDTILDLVGPAPNQEQDEFRCLNLNIAVPRKILENAKANKAEGQKLPVLVWVHGGAFVFGANTDRYAAIANLVHESIRLNNPVVVVSINYRLNYFGFLAHDQILKANSLAQSAGGCGNWGLYDQRVAFEWVQKYISAFGGDPERVTAIGHSAGSISLHGHLIAGKPLFQRAILASGVMAGMVGSSTLDSWLIKEEYENLQKYCQVSTFEELQRIPVEKLMEANAKLKTRPVSHIIDDSRVKGGFFENATPEKTGWIVHPDARDIPIMIGDTAVEGIIFLATIQKYQPEHLLQGLQKRLPSYLLKHHHLDIDTASPLNTPMHTIIPRMIEFCSDVPFSAPIARVVKEYPGEVYSYHWNRGHQFDGGRPKNIANHGVDMNYVFGGHIPHFPEDVDRELSRTAIGNLLTFVYGGEPWERRPRGEELSFVYGEDGRTGMEREDGSRRWGAYKEMYKMWNEVRDVWNDFLNMRL